MDLVVTTSLPPNILAHIYAAAGLMRNPSYYESYRHTLRQTDVEALRPFSRHFGHKPPMGGGPLFFFLYQIPSYLPADNPEDMFSNLDFFIKGLENRSFSAMSLDPEITEALEFWLPHEIIEYSMDSNESMLEELNDIFIQLKEVLTYTYKNFYREHWRKRKPTLLRRADEIQSMLDRLNIFDAWSEVFGIDFPYREFVVYICDALKGGTSLLAEKIALPIEVTDERAKDSIIHEIGVHFIIAPGEYLKRGLTPGEFIVHQEAIGRMEEAVTCYFKPQVYKRMGLNLGDDYHLPLMRIEEEMRRFTEVWEHDEAMDVYDGLLKACQLI